MSRKLLWSVFSILMVTLMLMVSCGPRAAPAPAIEPTPAATPAAPAPITSPAAPGPSTAPAALAEKPKYGGIINLIQPANIEMFSPVAAPARSLDGTLMGLVYEQYTNGNWAMGPAGSGEAFYSYGTSIGVMNWREVTGYLVESFEIPEIGVWKLNIRKGVHFALDRNSEASRLVNGREATADDVVWSINYLNTTPNSSIITSQPGLSKNAKVEKTGPWQVTLRTPVDPGAGWLWMLGGGLGSAVLYAREVQDKYGKTNEWQQTVGTGPYMQTDFVPGSAATFVRNPNYWQKNPVGPGKGDQLPYPDGVKVLIVPDFSTRMAAMRTARADRIEQVPFEDAQSLIQTSRGLQFSKYLYVTTILVMRIDKQDLPFKDKRVRQALMMATDFESFKRDFFKGEAEILTSPVAPVKGTEHLYWPIETLPEPARALFKYDPERAKQLLAEAGYPKGFKTSIIVQNTSSMIDSASVFKAMWAKAGVDLEIQPREASVYNSIKSARSNEEMLMTEMGSDWTNFASRYGWTCCRSRSPGYFDEAPGTERVIEAAYQEVNKYVTIDFPKADQVIHDLIPYFLEQAYWIPRPEPYSYRLWQPWLKNYYGESHYRYWIPYPWVDQDLKEQMTGRR